MKIAVDARELAGRPTGVGRYLAELLTEWADSPALLQHRWTLYSHQPLSVPAPFQGAVRVLPGAGGTRWEQWTLARALASDPPDVLFAPGYTAPLRTPCPTAVTIHDVSFAAHPEWFTVREGARRRMLTRLAAARARVVLTDSAFSRDQIARHLGVPRERITVIPLGMRQTRHQDSREQAVREPLVLFVGSIFTRRNVGVLIDAFTRHVAPRVPGSRLEIVGEDRSYPRVDLADRIARLPSDMRGRVALRSYVDAETLRRLYSSASVFAFPSEYEGFGLTPLEALAAGVPPIVLDTPIATEIYGPAARYVPAPLGAEPLGDAIVHLLTSATAREDVLQHTASTLARYRWDLAAARTFEALTGAARD